MTPRRGRPPITTGETQPMALFVGYRPRGGEATFADCLDALGLADDDLLSVGLQLKGSGFEGPQMTVRALKDMDLSEWDDRDVWVGLQPMRRVVYGRGSSGDVVDLVAIYADLDIGADKLPNEEAVWSVIEVLSAVLGAHPTYVTFSGHGFQPVWLVKSEGSQSSKLSAEVLAGWGQIVKEVAQEQGGTADSVFDAARILRVPGTTNWKDQDRPVRAKASAAWWTACVRRDTAACCRIP